MWAQDACRRVCNHRARPQARRMHSGMVWALSNFKGANLKKKKLTLRRLTVRSLTPGALEQQKGGSFLSYCGAGYCEGTIVICWSDFCGEGYTAGCGFWETRAPSHCTC